MSKLPLILSAALISVAPVGLAAAHAAREPARRAPCPAQPGFPASETFPLGQQDGLNGLRRLAGAANRRRAS